MGKEMDGFDVWNGSGSEGRRRRKIVGFLTEDEEGNWRLSRSLRCSLRRAKGVEEGLEMLVLSGGQRS